MKAISLFSGIGGLDIGFAAAGFDIIAQVEIDEYCQRVLRRHSPEWWPNAAIFADVRQFGRDNITGEIDVIFGGFPCQPHSVAGKQLGAEDDRDMWPQFRRIIGELRPRTVLLENVPGIITGYAVHIISDLTALGYDCRWGTIRASDTGTPHKRERWFCVAYTKCRGRKTTGITRMGREVGEGANATNVTPKIANRSVDMANNNGQRQLQQKRNVTRFRRRTTHKRQSLAHSQTTRLPGRWLQKRNEATLSANICAGKILGNTQGKRFQKRQSIGRNLQQKRTSAKRNGNIPRHRKRRLTKSRMGRATNGIPTWLDDPRWPAGQGSYQHESEAPRTIGKCIDPHRAARVKALGNAVVPQVAYPLACQIREIL